METDRFVCKHCEKVIRYERPLFCPYCGKQVDPTDGLEEQDGEIEIYKWSGIAPALVWLLTGWLVLLVPIALIFGRTGVTWLSVAFAIAALALMLLSFFVTPK